ncbi:Aryl-alcohol dehydrogenase-like predicted oxidoreductase OS=Streptomyces violarus OX=67380 GN=FHS41_000066 PE=4 SV=1 [Streptomyces violarus]
MGTGFVPWSPLGQGFLAGAFRAMESFAPDDMRLTMPRFSEPANLQSNLRLVDEVKAIADEAGVTPAQAVLAWLMAQGEDTVPIPGTRHVAYVEENTASVDVQLTPDHLARLSRLPAARGDRLSPEQMAILDWKTTCRQSNPLLGYRCKEPEH